jgi:hypothetical protein
MSFYLPLLALFMGLSLPLPAHEPGEEMAEAATRLLNLLTPEQRGKAIYALTHDERSNWHFVPRARNGLPFKEMNPDQSQAARQLLAAGLSAEGYRKATNIMTLENILADLEGPSRKNPRDPALYYFTIFGEPGPTNTWGWRVEGHHLAFNLTVIGGHLFATSPSFLGANPAEVKAGLRQGLRILAQEEDLGRQLVKSLDATQRTLAIISNQAPREIITGDARKITPLPLVGLPVAQMKPPEQDLLWRLISEYTGRCRMELAEKDRARIRQAGWEKVHFAWAGGLEKGQGHYYRVQGPTFLLEYDNTQNNNNHIHCVWRDFENDFGEDLLRRHYDQDPHK